MRAVQRLRLEQKFGKRQFEQRAYISACPIVADRGGVARRFVVRSSMPAR